MEIFPNPKVDWLGKKWIFLAVSAVLVVVGAISIATKGLNLGVDFTGGTLVYVKFKQEPQLDRIREVLSSAGLRPEEVTRFDDPSENQVQIRMARKAATQEQDLTGESDRIFQVLQQTFDPNAGKSGQFDLNNISRSALATRLQELDPERVRSKLTVSEYTSHYEKLAGQTVDFRDNQGGVLHNYQELSQAGVPTPVIGALQSNSYLGSFTVISVESVGPKVGDELKKRARDAIIFSLIGMLAYIAFRFRPIYGVAGVIALFHDVFITVGLFSLTGKEISLNVVAALLTLVGYSINDTIVIFDRVRENVRNMRRTDLATIINVSVNQTLNRTILTSGFTFLAVMALFLFGGEVLNGFAFALVIGIIVGCYSTLAIASPIVLWWQLWSEKRKTAKAAA